MAVGALRRFAASAPVPVYAAIGEGGLAATQDLSLSSGVRLARSPRHAALLLVVGNLRPLDRPELLRLHDQLPHPRATLWWGGEADAAFAEPDVVPADADPLPAIARVYRRLWLGERRSDPDLLPDEPPASWQGLGEHGQGGEGMMGGRPYGRPLAQPERDIRDGLQLDAYTARFGPFLSGLPPGLVIELTLQGDVIQEARVRRLPFRQDSALQPFRQLARVLHLLGLSALAERCIKAARRGSNTQAALGRWLRRSGVFDAVPRGLGEVGGTDVRMRLQGWSKAADVAPAPASGLLAGLLTGLEWSEAMLVANSFDTEMLRHISRADDGG